MPSKRKRSSIAPNTASNEVARSLRETPILPPAKDQTSGDIKFDTNPDHNIDIVDGITALRASPDADEKGEVLDVGDIIGTKIKGDDEDSHPFLCDIDAEAPPPASKKKQKKSPTKTSIAAKKGSDEIKAFKAEQAAKKTAQSKLKNEDEDDEWDKRVDPDGDDASPLEDVDVMKKEAGRPPPVNSGYLPLPWKGRLGYVSEIVVAMR